MKSNKINSRRKWTEEEIIFLEANWGVKTIKYIEKKLNRSSYAIKHKVRELKLGGGYSSGDYLLAKQIANMFGCDMCVVKRWFSLGLPYTTKPIIKRKMYRVKLSDLIIWLKNNQDQWSSIKLEKYSLGQESEWLIKKRNKDLLNTPKNNKKRFTTREDQLIISLFKLNKSAKQIARETNRSLDSIKNRLKILRKQGKINYVNPSWNSKKNRAVS